MTRGHQRDEARAKNLAKSATSANSTIAQAHSTAEIMRQKQQAAEEKKKAAEAERIACEQRGEKPPEPEKKKVTQSEKKSALALQMALSGRQAPPKPGRKN
eukprot:gnl/MRDRNA2_/MRDRNA2_29911_c0_seq1.p1 gnl/MRDRNA2_/MRDRNA2_29911_c0~~gnl/MRDRNA2_/MRDRNA2_29911_c0_seq1.p1  ORF type:complete len:101 (+),score=34.46 gnl/MRDRNA2_/MRDRNA2_29911_c0_seq1:112-414(+)